MLDTSLHDIDTVDNKFPVLKGAYLIHNCEAYILKIPLSTFALLTREVDFKLYTVFIGNQNHMRSLKKSQYPGCTLDS